jgi:hypothetical protein
MLPQDRKLKEFSQQLRKDMREAEKHLSWSYLSAKSPLTPPWNHNSPFPPLILRGGAAGGGVMPKRGTKQIPLA